MSPAGRPSADARLRRILAMVPWVVSANGPTVEEVCQRFAVTPAQLTSDLELLFLCGVPPYGVGDLIEAGISKGRVWIQLADYFAAPLRLTPAEGLAVLAAGAGLLATEGTDPAGPLARALDKLAVALGVAADDVVDVTLGSTDAGMLEQLRGAVRDNRQVRIEHYSYGRDEWNERTVDPYLVFSAGGQFSLYGWCHRAGAERRFRLDRIRRAEVLDTTFAPPDRVVPPPIFEAGPDDVEVVLDLAPEARWVIESHPVDDVEEQPGGVTRVRLRVSHRPWLERLLLRLGPAATVVAGAEGVAGDAAARILRRYVGPVTSTP